MKFLGEVVSGLLFRIEGEFVMMNEAEAREAHGEGLVENGDALIPVFLSIDLSGRNWKRETKVDEYHWYEQFAEKYLKKYERSNHLL